MRGWPVSSPLVRCLTALLGHSLLLPRRLCWWKTILSLREAKIRCLSRLRTSSELLFRKSWLLKHSCNEPKAAQQVLLSWYSEDVPKIFKLLRSVHWLYSVLYSLVLLLTINLAVIVGSIIVSHSTWVTVRPYGIGCLYAMVATIMLIMLYLHLLEDRNFFQRSPKKR